MNPGSLPHSQPMDLHKVGAFSKRHDRQNDAIFTGRGTEGAVLNIDPCSVLNWDEKTLHPVEGR